MVLKDLERGITDDNECCGVSRSTVYQLLKSGELKAVRVGRVRRVSQNHLVEYIMKLEQKEDNWVLSDYSAKRAS